MNGMKLLLTIVIACSFVTEAYAQRSKTRRSGALVVASKPAVFLTFLRLTNIKPDDPANDPNYLFFRLTNNSRWPIWLQMSGVSKKEYGDASLYYAIEDKETGAVRIGSTQCHVCSVNPLRAGDSIVFSIPLGDAGRDARMRIEYSFAWERDNEIESGSYSEHSVVFYFSYLPSSVFPTTALSNNGIHPTSRHGVFH